MTAKTKALAELTPDHLVVQLAEVVRLGCRAFAASAARNGCELPAELADLQTELHLRAAEVRAQEAALRRRAAAGTGQGGTAVASRAVPAPTSTHDEPEWLTTGQASRRTGLSKSYLRRLARGQHPGARRTERGHHLWRSDRLPTRGGLNKAADAAGKAA